MFKLSEQPMGKVCVEPRQVYERFVAEPRKLFELISDDTMCLMYI